GKNDATKPEPSNRDQNMNTKPSIDLRASALFPHLGAVKSCSVIMWCMVLWLLRLEAFGITLGDRVQANGTVNVRQTPAGTLLGSQASGSLGVTIGGPTVASLNGTSYTWWNVNFDSGTDGWVADIGLMAVVPAAPTLISPCGNPMLSTANITFSWN